MAEHKAVKRIIQEYVPGKQITLTHIIASPTDDVYIKLGIDNTHDSIGILTVTPAEAAIIAGDMAIKSGGVEIGFLDRFSGTVIFHGQISALQAAFEQVEDKMTELLHFSVGKITQN